MTDPPDGLPSKKAINRAGDRLRDWWMNPNLPEFRELIELEDPLVDDIALAFDWRATFQYPLNKVSTGLKGFVMREMGLPKNSRIPVGQRLKRIPTIIDKLARHEHMDLTTMQDIGGCRAVVDDLDQVEGVLKRVRKNWVLKRPPDDYIADPKRSGYRAVHVVVVRDTRLVEIQLRTAGQNAWAQTVERMGQHADLRQLKFGVGPPKVLTFLRMAADGIAMEDRGDPVPADFMSAFQALREEVLPYLPRNPVT